MTSKLGRHSRAASRSQALSRSYPPAQKRSCCLRARAARASCVKSRGPFCRPQDLSCRLKVETAVIAGVVFAASVGLAKGKQQVAPPPAADVFYDALQASDFSRARRPQVRDQLRREGPAQTRPGRQPAQTRRAGSNCGCCSCCAMLLSAREAGRASAKAVAAAASSASPASAPTSMARSAAASGRRCPRSPGARRPNPRS